MSLEQALAENTSAIKELTAMWATLNKQAKTIVTDTEAGKTTGVTIAATKHIGVAPSPKPEPTPAPIPVAVEAVAIASPVIAVESPSEITYEQVSKAITDTVKTDKNRVIATLAKFSVKRGPELKVEQYADFLKALAA